ncbi:long-chain fatty acid--CoA ligase [Fervidibacillus halotolerans]|uniref:Long-chain fatty acid--CoA ligase n=1 Tax=Fervidibacillus halotolerans TaxID=2980027 RepID=A0A9E8M400_9BACI|nr:long-chain fatty acid--CoA ligase [Fervidibacillus halotolerans]WAA13974.1 long-chain fatty acid--CoA ligase [Fervidibacillus halotolerans]
MMDVPLTLTQMVERAEKYYPKKVIISRTTKGIFRYTYKEMGERTRSLASALKKLGVEKGDRIGTFAWNDHRHLETYFAIPCIGAILHTINIRLSPDHLSYVINHAEDKIIFVDATLLPVLEKVRDHLNTVKAIVVMGDADELPKTGFSNVYSYEKLLEIGDKNFEFPNDIEENDAAGMCYTSATTGKPKGVVYSHRGIVLHAMALGLADTVALSESDIIMPVVPMFHVNAWGTPFASTWYGTTQVFPGPMPTPKDLAELIETFHVTVTAGVPTILIGLLNEFEKKKYKTDSLRGVLCGGSAAPKGIIQAYEKKFHIPFFHAYGMTETTPLVTISKLKSYQQNLPYEEQLEIRAKQGVVVPGLEIKVVNENGEVKRDGKEMGELLVRGPWIAKEYYKDERTKESFKDGWLHTGDVVTIDEEGFIKIVDRTKDLIKSGGEWISSVDLENALMTHDAVLEAAVVAVPHPKWMERPVACVVLKEGKQATKEELIDYLRPQFAKWWLPDEVLFLDEIPKTTVGKFLKAKLREYVAERLKVSES